jgi:hypothetical protein
MKKILYTIVILGFFLRCRDDDTAPPCNDPSNLECENYDPCFYSSETSADFTIAEQVSPIPPYHIMYVEDTVAVAGEIRFKAIDTTAEYYKWYLGTEIVEGPNEFEVKREIRTLQLGTYFAALVVQKQVDSACFPLDDGIDSVFQNFYKVNICSLKIANKFKGVFDQGSTDSTIIELGFFNSNINPECGVDGRLYAINFFGANDTIGVSFESIGILNSIVIWNGTGIGTNLNGELKIEGNKVKATYTYRSIDYSFRGIILK